MKKKQFKRTSNQKKNTALHALPVIVSVMAFLVGAGIFVYPVISNIKAEYEQKTIINTYEATVSETEQDVLDEAWSAAEEYNETLTGDPVHDPFAYGTGYALPDNYADVLNLNDDGVMGYIEIPKISVYLPIYHGTSEESLEKGAGHLEQSTLPIGGEGRHAIISAHRGLPEAEMFTNLNQLKEDDQFYIHILGKTLAYEVDDISIVEPADLSKLVAYEGEDYVTLLTCTPYGINTRRLLVRGVRVEYNPEVHDTIVESAGHGWLNKWAIGVCVGAISITLIIVVGKKRKK